MNKELKTRWVKALRSGNYTQGTNYLKSGDTYCCLGVLADVYDPEGWSVSAWALEGKAFCLERLPTAFLQKIALTVSEESELTKLNDIDERSFKEIADHVEKTL